MQAIGLPAVPVDPPRMWLRTDPGTAGEAADALRVELTGGAVLAGELERTSTTEWTGDLRHLVHVITLAGSMVSPGRIELRGDYTHRAIGMSFGGTLAGAL